ncbi:golgin subfamily A member 6-like protein 22 [Piliocolobus tephrosceles]|uniref:golgin subfamily A member 6-like protein 22 n=2 Tax=Piliocolobus tephrosceles TaxID=591936 RepID=UPI000E6B2802|nr:golgin subfamily A member 6-like protein 22 [Piliocolobus tephrosceles]XP_026309002.1 golgin subfamily A member 6-like protein 22 [Piliocolobus tephrosceles]
MIEVFENFHHMVKSIDDFFYKDEDLNVFQKKFNKNKEMYNALVEKVATQNKKIEWKKDDLLSMTDEQREELKMHQEYIKHQILELNKKIEWDKLEAERKKKELEEEEERERKKKELEEEEERERKKKELEEEKERERQKKVLEEEEKEKQKKALEAEEEKRRLKKILEEEEEERERQRQELEEQANCINYEEKKNILAEKVEQIQKLIQEKNSDVLTFEDCIDIIYKVNLPLTNSKKEELRSMKNIKKEELIKFIKGLVVIKQDVLEDMISFFQIWDVQKKGYIHKNLFLSILKQFGDGLNEEEENYLRAELDQSADPYVEYAKLLNKWISEEEK